MKTLRRVRRSSTLAAVLVLGCLAWTSTCFGRITFENKTDDKILVYLQAQNQQMQGPYEIAPRSQVPFNLAPGVYRVVTNRNGRVEDTGWKNFSDHKMTYSVTSCHQCMPGGAVVMMDRTEVFHASGTYVCPKCGHLHVAWVGGWDSEIERTAAFPDFNPVGTYRLGVSVMDGDGGAVVTNVITDSPATRMQRVDFADGINYTMQSGINLVTHVNGERVQNANEFAAAIARSDRDLQVRIYNSERQSSRDYSTKLGY